MRSRGWTPPATPRARTAANAVGLTRREGEVLRLVSEGLSDALIADRLVLSRRTVEHHVAAILTTLDISSRHEAQAAAGNLGIDLDSFG